jgi:hypothetical protein
MAVVVVVLVETHPQLVVLAAVVMARHKMEILEVLALQIQVAVAVAEVIMVLPMLVGQDL